VRRIEHLQRSGHLGDAFEDVGSGVRRDPVAAG
jgi:hypothetical protein